MKNRTWAEQELVLLSDQALSLAEVAALTGRSLSAVEHKASRLGIDRISSGAHRGGRGQPKIRNGRPGWQGWELELLRDPEVPLTEITKATGRTYSAVRHKAHALGVTHVRDYWLRGGDHPLWRGGPGPARGSDWNQVRAAVLERDGHTCQDGGEFYPSALGLVVHHAVPYRFHPVNDPRWLVTLCVRHHLKRPEHWWKEVPEHIAALLAEGR